MLSHDSEQVKSMLVKWLNEAIAKHPDTPTFKATERRTISEINKYAPGATTIDPFALKVFFTDGDLWDRVIDNYMTNPALHNAVHTFATYKDALEFFKPIILNTIMKSALLISLINIASAKLISKSVDLAQADYENSEIEFNANSGDVTITTVDRYGYCLTFTIVTTRDSRGYLFALEREAHLNLMVNKFG